MLERIIRFAAMRDVSFGKVVVFDAVYSNVMSVYTSCMRTISRSASALAGTMLLYFDGPVGLTYEYSAGARLISMEDEARPLSLFIFFSGGASLAALALILLLRRYR